MAAALAAGLATWACGGPAARRPDVIFLLVDTLRRDHLGTYGYERATTPFLDALAAQGTVFEHAVAQAPWTGASMASLWTSRLPSEVGGLARPDARGVAELGRTPLAALRGDVPTLAGRLADAGYDTRAFVANGYAGDALGLLRGFRLTREEPLAAEALVSAALRSLALEPAGEPLFLYLHFRDVHEPTWPPERYLGIFYGGEKPDRSAAGWRHGAAPDPDAPEVQAFRRQKIALYDASLHYVDGEIGRLAQGLVQLRPGRPVVFVLASDHGEAFWEHTALDRRLGRDPRGLAGIGHGHALFGEVLDVPLILSGAGVPRGRDGRLVRNLDVAPTVLGLAGAEPPPGMRGRDLLAPDPEASPAAAFSENIAYGGPARSLQLGGAKLVRYGPPGEVGAELLFDRTADPRELRDVRAEQPERARRLGARLDALERELAGARTGPLIELDEDTRERLRALGYGPPAPADAAPSPPDPSG